VLRDPAALRRITRAARGWEELGRHPTPERLFRLSERFTDLAGLASPPVRRAVRALRGRGASACQAMFGQSFFALPMSASARTASLDWLRSEGLRAVEIHSSATGARVLRSRLT
jgi:pantoate kinase